MATQGRDIVWGNPTLPCPGDEYTGLIEGIPQRHRLKKRLVVLCDGTWQDSNNAKAQIPTNITRLARALAPNAWEEVPEMPGFYTEIEQIVYYSAGVGTFEGNIFWGGVFGTGLSEIVRAAYGFLASNYEHGDEICVFGFSRGAYVARSIVGLVADHGLLTKRGMDNFHAVYEACYNTDTKLGINEKLDLGLRPLPKGAVKAIGVFDTVGFHNPITFFLNRRFSPRRRLFGKSDRDEFKNTELSPNVKYAFHALSLDEHRTPFQTTLFFKPKKVNPEYIAPDDPDASKSEPWTTTLKQVWFRGYHSDVGGGYQDSYLSNIALGWMISQLVENNILEFDQKYLLDDPPAFTLTQHQDYGGKWAVVKGPNSDKYIGSSLGSIMYYIKKGLYHVVLQGKSMTCFLLHYVFFSPKKALWFSGVRTPGRYVPMIDATRQPEIKDQYTTCEEIHESVSERVDKDRGEKEWHCKALKDFVYDDELGGWRFKRANSWGSLWSTTRGDENVGELPQHRASEIENFLKGKIRFKQMMDPGKAIRIPPQDKETIAHPVKLHPDLPAKTLSAISTTNGI